MRVLMFGWEFPPHNSGGLGVACEGLARALVDKSVQLVFVLPKKVSLANERLRFLFAGIGTNKVHGIDTALTPYVTAKEYLLSKRYLEGNIYGADLFSEVMRYAKSVRDLIENETFDVIHAHDWLSFLAGVEAKRISGKPLVVHVHATGFDQAGGNMADERVYAIEKIGFDAADKIITVSQYTKDMLVSKYGVSGEKIFVVHNGIDSSAYTGTKESGEFPWKRTGQKMVLFVGRLTMHKGPDYFLKAARRVLDFCPDTMFVIAGSGDMEFQIIRQAAELGIAQNVFFAGFARGENLRRLYESADLYVLPSVSEPFGITPLEALANGTPVLISKQSGVSEVLSHALKVDFWDIDEMANKIIAVLRYPPLTRQLALYGNGEVRTITWKKAAEKCIALYNDMKASSTI